MVCIYALNTFWIWLLIMHPSNLLKTFSKEPTSDKKNVFSDQRKRNWKIQKKKGLLMPFLLFKSDVQVNGMQFCRSSLLQIITFKATLHKRRLMHLIAVRNKVCTFQYRIHYIHSNRAWRLEKALRSHNS